MAEKKPFWPQWFRRKNASMENQAPEEVQELTDEQEPAELQQPAAEQESPPPISVPEPSAPAPEQPTDQVSRAFEDLMARYQNLLQEPPASPQPETPPAEGYGEFSRHLLGEAERVAATVKMRAQQEAEVEAARIISEAKTTAQEVLGRAQQKAHDDTRREVENILLSAQKRAQIYEDRAEQAAQLFLVRARNVHRSRSKRTRAPQSRHVRRRPRMA